MSIRLWLQERRAAGTKQGPYFTAGNERDRDIVCAPCMLRIEHQLKESLRSLTRILPVSTRWSNWDFVRSSQPRPKSSA